MPDTQLTPEQQYQQYLVCGDIMRLIRGLTVVCAQTEFDHGIHLCSDLLAQVAELRAAFEPEEFFDEAMVDE